MNEADVYALGDYYGSLIEGTTGQLREDIEFARGQAFAYLWGRLDAGDTSASGYAGDAFPFAYAIMVTRSKTDSQFSLAIREAWESFRQYGEIRDHNGRALDRPTVSESGQ